MPLPFEIGNNLGYVDRVLQAKSPAAGTTTPKTITDRGYGFRILTGANYIDKIEVRKAQDGVAVQTVGEDDERSIFDGMTLSVPTGFVALTFHWATDVPNASTTEGIARAVVRIYTVPVLAVIDDTHGLACKGSVRPLDSSLHLNPTEAAPTLATGTALVVADDPRAYYQQRKGSFANSRQHHTIGDDTERRYPWFPTTDVLLGGFVAHDGASNTDLDIYVYAYTYNGSAAPELVPYAYMPGGDNCENLGAGTLLNNPGLAAQTRVMNLGTHSVVAAGRSGPIPYPPNGVIIYAVNQSLALLTLRGSIWTYSR